MSFSRFTCAKSVLSKPRHRGPWSWIDVVKKEFRCWAEVDLDALRGNLAWLRHCVGAGVKLLTVVKADAYGHG
ncbi:MAG TPA: alanine racemase, partial [Verrucomicrobiae bacterium]|nr:alanine racemase [Verrucomicrobiae bacterium]